MTQIITQETVSDAGVVTISRGDRMDNLHERGKIERVPSQHHCSHREAPVWVAVQNPERGSASGTFVSYDEALGFLIS